MGSVGNAMPPSTRSSPTGGGRLRPARLTPHMTWPRSVAVAALAATLAASPVLGARSAATPAPIAAALGTWTAANPQTSAVAWRLDPSGPVEVLAYKPDTPRRPASTMKIVTAATALLALSPNFRFETRLYAGVERTADRRRAVRARSTSRATAIPRWRPPSTRDGISTDTAATSASSERRCVPPGCGPSPARSWSTRRSSTPSAGPPPGRPATRRNASRCPGSRSTRATWVTSAAATSRTPLGPPATASASRGSASGSPTREPSGSARPRRRGGSWRPPPPRRCG